LQVVAHAQIESEFVGDTESVIGIKSVVDLLTGNQRGVDDLTEEVILNVTGIVGIAKQEVGKAVSAKARQTGAAKRKRTACDVSCGPG
jgi:predicted transcriptional regulator